MLTAQVRTPVARAGRDGVKAPRGFEWKRPLIDVGRLDGDIGQPAAEVTNRVIRVGEVKAELVEACFGERLGLRAQRIVVSTAMVCSTACAFSSNK
jgi:hypothetical protein